MCQLIACVFEKFTIHSYNYMQISLIYHVPLNGLLILGRIQGELQAQPGQAHVPHYLPPPKMTVQSIHTRQTRFLQIIPKPHQPGLPWPLSWPCTLHLHIYLNFITQSSLSFLSTWSNHRNFFLFRTPPIASKRLSPSYPSALLYFFSLKELGTTHPLNHFGISVFSNIDSRPFFLEGRP